MERSQKVAREAIEMLNTVSEALEDMKRSIESKIDHHKFVIEKYFLKVKNGELVVDETHVKEQAYFEIRLIEIHLDALREYIKYIEDLLEYYRHRIEISPSFRV